LARTRAVCSSSLPSSPPTTSELLGEGAQREVADERARSSFLHAFTPLIFAAKKQTSRSLSFVFALPSSLPTPTISPPFKITMWIWSDFTPLERRNIGIYVAGESFEPHSLFSLRTKLISTDGPSFVKSSGIMLYKLGLEAFNGSMCVYPFVPLVFSFYLSPSSLLRSDEQILTEERARSFSVLLSPSALSFSFVFLQSHACDRPLQRRQHFWEARSAYRGVGPGANRVLFESHERAKLTLLSSSCTQV